LRRFVGSYTYAHICVSRGTIVDRNKNRRTFWVQKDMVKKWLCILLSLFVCTSVWANKDSLSVAERNALQGFNDTIDRLDPDFVRVSLFVADPGDVMYSTLGHAALHLECPTFGLDYVFTYESEDIPQRVLSFFAGRLKMGMMAIPSADYLQYYAGEQRRVMEYRLNLSPEQKMELWRVLDEIVQEGMDKPYDYVEHGCAVSCLQSLQAVPGLKINYNIPKEIRRMTIKDAFYAYSSPGWARFEIITIAGGVVDDIHYPQLKRLIAPQELLMILKQSSVDGKPFIVGENELLSGIPREHTWFSPMVFALLVLLLAMANFFFRQEYISIFVLSIQTLMGCLITYLVCFSTLCATEWNWLIIPFNILPAICWHWRKYWALPFMAIVTIWSIVMAGQMMWGHVLVDWPHIVLALAFAAVLLKQYLVKTK